MSELEELRKQKDQAYWERDQLVLALSKLYPAWLARHPEEDKEWENDWRWIVFIEIPTKELELKQMQGGFLTKHVRQISWHIHDSEVESFAHLQIKPNTWDRHTTEEKYRRLRHIIKRR